MVGLMGDEIELNSRRSLLSTACSDLIISSLSMFLLLLLSIYLVIYRSIYLRFIDVNMYSTCVFIDFLESKECEASFHQS